MSGVQRQSQLWDTAFAVLRLLWRVGWAESPSNAVVRSAYHYLDISQVQEDVADRE